ncbi:unnamed protein product, partial [Mesorhabditis belari]|uniref:RRM domain-containing protein n=1 Tax=Mesorhabditis belari TaxID=2138241 RepID=A0AAF3FFM4_9BILA
MPKRTNEPTFDQEHGWLYKKQKSDDVDPRAPDPSKVIHIRNLRPQATEGDLVEAFNHFGTVAYCILVPHKRQGLVEFLEIESAIKTMDYLHTGGQVVVLNSPVLANYSTSAAIERIGFESATPSHVLVLNVKNIQDNHIDADIIHKITHPHGAVQRIAVVRRNFGVLALVEFATVEEATRAKYALNGADIYSGSCTLKIEYSKEESVKVRANDADHRDYVNPEVPRQKPPLLDSTNFFNTSGPFQALDAVGYQNMQRRFNIPTKQRFGFYYPIGDRTNDYSASSSETWRQDTRSDYAHSPPTLVDRGSVVMVYGLDHTQFTCQILFNLFCLYGNVNKIRFMRRKTDTAMVQMENSVQALTLVRNMDEVDLFGKTLQIRIAKQNEVIPDPDPFQLEKDLSLSFVDFTGSRLQRYLTPEFASRNHPIRPTDTLHFFNAPPTITEEKLYAIWNDAAAPCPQVVHINAGTSRKSVSGFIKFEQVTQATESLALVNHTPIHTDHKLPWILKLGFYDGDFSKFRPIKDKEV